MAEAKVAGYDAVVLEANDAEALNRWLKEHGYASSPELVDWFKPYIEQHWRISAFKIDSAAAQVSTKAVRMSFHADKPFFPYREPASQRSASAQGKSRELRVFFLADGRVSGTLGASGVWDGQTAWSDRIDGHNRDRLLVLANLPAGTAPSATWLTEVVDKSSPRYGVDDIFFGAAPDQTVVKRPVKYESREYIFWVGVLILAGIGWLGYVVLRRSNRKSQH